MNEVGERSTEHFFFAPAQSHGQCWIHPNEIAVEINDAKYARRKREKATHFLFGAFAFADIGANTEPADDHSGMVA